MGERAHRKKADAAAARVGLRVRRLRQLAGFSFDAFVEEVGLGRGYVSELERGLVVPSLTALRRMAQALDVTAADLVLEGSPREQLFEAARSLSDGAVAKLLAEARALQPPPPKLELRRVASARAKTSAGALPVLALKATAGGWGRATRATLDGYVRVLLRSEAKRGLFVTQVAGHALTPEVSDGAYGLFSRPWTSPLEGELGLFVQWGAAQEGRFSVRRFAAGPEQGQPFARFVRVVG